MAENERLKGNEFMQSKEFQEAVKCYSKSLELNPTDAATFANRALAHLRLKEYAKTIEDATKAIEIKPDYLKAFHRRGKAYQAVNKLEYAVKDF
jgi:tetratricopeptide (TPR) repeat protein